MFQKNYNKKKSIPPHFFKIVMVFLLFLLSRPIKGQNQPTIDSLKKMLGTTQFDVQRINLLNKLSKALLDIDYHQSLQYWNESLQLSEKMNDTINMMEAYFNIGQINVNYSLNYKNGIEHLLEALKLVRKTDRRKSEMSILGLIGFVHNRQGNFGKAIEYYKKAIAIAQKNNYENEYLNFSSYIADLFETNGVVDSAIEYYGKIYEIEEGNHFMGTKPVSLFSIGKYFQLKKDFLEATRFYSKALKEFEKQDNHRWAAYTYHILADMALEKRDYKMALENANKGLALAEKYNLVKEISDNHYSLSSIYDSLGNYEMAFKHFKIYDAIGDSIYSIERTKEISDLQNDYEMTFKKQELEMLVKEKEMQAFVLKKNRVILYVLSFGSLFLILLILFIWIRYKQKQKINNVLKDRDELRELKMEDIVKQLNQEVNQHKLTQIQLEASNEELNNFMYRSSHDLRSPLLSIMGLTTIALQAETDEERLEILGMINQSTGKLRKLLDEMVESIKVTDGNIKITPINLFQFIEEIIHELKNADYFKNVNVAIELDKNLEIHTDENMLRGILQNLIDNGIKYKNNSISDPFVKIEAEWKEDIFRIKISDNGQGIAEDQQAKVFDMFVRSNLDSHGSGLGLYIVKKSVKKLGGTIHLESKLGVGSTFSILLPSLLMKEKK